MSNETRTAGETAAAGQTAKNGNTNAKRTIREAVEAEIASLINEATLPGVNTYETRQAAGGKLAEVNEVYSFNEYEREHGNPDNALEEMWYLDELAECGGDWGKPSYMLARAFYGYRFNPYADENAEREPFNPNDDYFYFNGYGNLVSVKSWDWAYYWAGVIDADSYTDAADDEGKIEELAEVLGLVAGEDYADPYAEDAEDADANV